MRVVTSIGPNRTERQQKCIASWLAIGCEVTAVQSAGETELLKPLYPEVSFVETNLVGNVFNRPKLVRISALMNQAENDEVLILNSDIEVRSSQQEFMERWSPAGHKKIKVGLRWDEDPATKELKLFQWGIDAFLITPQIRSELRDIGMTMGCPAWDYWIPIHLNRRGYGIITNREQELIHENHERQWSDNDYNIGIRLLRTGYSMNQKQSAVMIKRLTGRMK